MYDHNTRRPQVTTAMDNIKEHTKVSFTVVKPL